MPLALCIVGFDQSSVAGSARRRRARARLAGRAAPGVLLQRVRQAGTPTASIAGACSSQLGDRCRVPPRAKNMSSRGCVRFHLIGLRSGKVCRGRRQIVHDGSSGANASSARPGVASRLMQAERRRRCCRTSARSAQVERHARRIRSCQAIGSIAERSGIERAGPRLC